MSPTRFDELARALAAPVSRRGAMRAGAAFALATVLPATWARPARALQTCDGRNELCRTAGEINCGRITGSENCWCCPPGQCGPENGRCCTNICGDKCCDDGEQCVDGECERCPSERLCGATCCEEGKVCRNPATGLCCVKAWKVCVAGRTGAVRCCPPGDQCCLNFKTQTAQCCNSPEQVCKEGACVCKEGIRCRSRCCDRKKEVCSDGRCCPKGEIRCGHGCCAKSRCCHGKRCCSATENCLPDGSCSDELTPLPPNRR